MEKEVFKVPEFKQYYLSELEFFDGNEFITFNIVGINVTRNTIAIPVSDQSKISIIGHELMADKDDNLYFEYGCEFRKIYLDGFTEI